MKLAIIAVLSLAICSIGICKNGNAVLIETESFQQKGGWVIDQQSMDVMAQLESEVAEIDREIARLSE